jgi:hypothetical protein
MSDSDDTPRPLAAPAPPQATAPAVPAKPVGEPIDAADMADIGRVVVAKAKEGDMKAAEVARKTWRWPQTAVHLDLPPVTDAASLAAAHAAVIAAAAASRLSTRQALDFSTMLEYRRRAVETFEIETKIRELYAEKRKNGESPTRGSGR